MNERLTAGAAVLLTSITAGTRGVLRLWPAPTGRHRRVPGAVVGQQFVDCPTCGVETAATRHGDALLCAEGHLVVSGGVQ